MTDSQGISMGEEILKILKWGLWDRRPSDYPDFHESDAEYFAQQAIEALSEAGWEILPRQRGDCLDDFKFTLPGSASGGLS